MTPLVAAAGVAVALGAAVAIGARTGRASVLGVLVALVFTPFTAEPLPGIPVTAFRIVAGLLAAYLLLVASRRSSPAAASPLGLGAAVAAAVAAFVVGLGATAVNLPAFGPPAALAAGLAALVVAVPPIALARDAFRLGVSSLILLDAGLLLRAGLAGTPPGLEALVAGAAIVALAVAATALGGAAATAAGEAGSGPRAGSGAPLVTGPGQARPAAARAGWARGGTVDAEGPASPPLP